MAQFNDKPEGDGVAGGLSVANTFSAREKGMNSSRQLFSATLLGNSSRQLFSALGGKCKTLDCNPVVVGLAE